MVIVSGLLKTSTVPIFAVIVAVVGAAGAVYVKLHTPPEHVPAPRVPVVAAIARSLGTTFNTGLLKASFTTTVIVVVPFTAMVVATAPTELFVGSGAAAWTTALRRITVVPAVSATVVAFGRLRTPVSV